MKTGDEGRMISRQRIGSRQNRNSGRPVNNDGVSATSAEATLLLAARERGIER